MLHIILIISLIIFYSTTAFSAFNIKGGSRAKGLAGAFVAIADDSNAIWYNPAGLSLLPRQELTITYNKPFWGLDYEEISNSMLTYTQPLGERDGFGLGGIILNIGIYKETTLCLSYSHRFGDEINPFIIGITLKGLEKKIKRFTDNDPVFNYGLSKRGLSIDLGTLWKINNIVYGLVLENINQPNLGFMDKDVVPWSINAGVVYNKYRLKPAIQINYRNSEISGKNDIDYIFGIESWFSDKTIGLRAGANPQEITFGITYNFQETDSPFPFLLNYAYSYPLNSIEDTNNSHYLSMSLQLGNIRPEYGIMLKKIRLNNIFPAHYKSYQNLPVGKLVIKNLSQQTLKNVEVNLSLEGCTEDKFNKIGSIPAGASKEIFLNAYFKNNLLEIDKNIFKEAQIQVTYWFGGTKGKKTIKKDLFIYHRNAICWDELAKIGSFITPDDSKIKYFITACNLEEYVKNSDFFSKNVLKAILVFDALRIYGVKYDSDRHMFFFKKGKMIDHIQFPQQTLRMKAGDCEDLVVLYASCLEQLGIPTAVVITSEYVFLIFDTQIDIKDAKKIRLNKNLYICRNNHIWIPIDMSQFGLLFMDAWVKGMDMYERHKEELKIIDIKNAWQKYPSADFLQADDWMPNIPDKTKIKRLLNTEIENISFFTY